MRVRVDNPALLPDLVADLSRRIDAIVEQVGPAEIEVSLLGSRHHAADVAELGRRLEAWGGGAEIDESAWGSAPQ